MSAPDLALVLRCQQGDVRAFETLVSAYEKKVYNLALRLTGDPEDASDLAQEAFLRAYKRLPDFRGDSSFATWLFRIVHNVCLDELRKRQRRAPAVSLDEAVYTEEGEAPRQIADERAGPEDLAQKKDIQRIVQDAIKTIPEDYRIALILRDLQGHSYEEIADIMGLNLGTVKSRINRARQALKERLAGQELFVPSVVHKSERGEQR